MFNLQILSPVMANYTDIQKMFIQFGGDYMIWFILVGFLVFLAIKLIGQAFSIVKLSVFAVPITFLLNLLVRQLVQFPLVNSINPILSQNNLPADQTVLSVTIALIVMSESKIFGGILLIVSGFIGFSRVLGGAQKMEDILLSFIIAITGLIISKIIMRMIKI